MTGGAGGRGGCSHTVIERAAGEAFGGLDSR
jgi:hypothetical protein